MTDPTVDPDYYRDPLLYACGDCGAVWRYGCPSEVDLEEFTVELDHLLDTRDSHRCVPGVTQAEVEQVRALAARHCAGHAMRTPGEMRVDAAVAMFGDRLLAEMMDEDMAMIDEVVAAFLADCSASVATLAAAAPMVKFVERHLWETVLHHATRDAQRQGRA